MKKQNIDSELLKKMCHDLRNPLSVMKITVDLFQMSSEFKTTTPKVRQVTKTINKQIGILVKRISSIEKKNK